MPNPLPQSLKKECEQATELLTSFYEQKFVPDILYKKAKGIAVLHVVKVGIGFSIRGGSGIVIAYNHKTGAWGAPAGIEMVGGGWGAQIGGQVSDILLILNTDAAVKAYCGGSVTLGGALSAAAGPYGKNAEADITVSKNLAAVYTYSSSKGLFAGASLEGTKMITRDKANQKYYGDSKDTLEILMKQEPPHSDFRSLYAILNKMKESGSKKNHTQDTDNKAKSGPGRPTALGSATNKTTASTKSLGGDKKQPPRTASAGRPVKVKVIYSYTPERRADLELIEGDIVKVEEMEGEWWVGTSTRTGKFGSFPSNYVQLAEM